MFNLFNTNLLEVANPKNGSDIIMIIVVYGALFLVLYLLFIRPKSKKQKEEAKMRESITVGDEVTTIGGIMGRIVAVREEEDAFIIETGSDRVKMKFKKWAISTVDTKKEAEQPTNAEQEQPKGFFAKLRSDKKESE